MYNAVSQNKTQHNINYVCVCDNYWNYRSVYRRGTDSYSLALIIFICAILYAWLQYFIAGKLAMMMTGAQEISKK